MGKSSWKFNFSTITTSDISCKHEMSSCHGKKLLSMYQLNTATQQYCMTKFLNHIFLFSIFPFNLRALATILSW